MFHDGLFGLVLKSGGIVDRLNKTLEKIFHFFETQIMANLFSQTLLENQLARHASRVNSMESALVNIEEETKKLNQISVRLKHLSQNKKQLETISGVISLLE